MLTPTRTVCLLLSAAGCFAAIIGAGTRPRSDGAPPDALPLTLQTIRETRASNLDPDADTPARDGSLELTYRVALPEGTRIAQVRQPEQITATDGEGADLTKIPPDLFDRVQHLVFDEGFGDHPTLRLVLAAASRKATAFSVSLRAQAVTFQGIESFDVKRSEQWTPLDHPTFAGMNASCRVVEEDAGVRLVVRPAAAREWIEAALPATPDATPGGYSVSWDDESATFDVDPRPEPGQSVRVFVKAGLKVIPIEIDEKDRTLP